MARILEHVRRQSIAYLALFVSLGGTGYAAVRLGRGSVGTNAVKNHAITPIKFDKDKIAGYLRAFIQINGQGQIVQSRPKARLIVWRTSFEPGGLIQWSAPMPAACFALATTNTQAGLVSYASAQLASGGKSNAQTSVLLSAAGQPVVIGIFCPQP
jgi:hypothetical protein